jgi:ABC-type anion transport system duplicated permease subunit
MSAGVLVCNHFISNDLFKLLLGGLIGTCIYLLAAFLMKIQDLYDIKELIQNILLSKK